MHGQKNIKLKFYIYLKIFSFNVNVLFLFIYLFFNSWPVRKTNAQYVMSISQNLTEDSSIKDAYRRTVYLDTYIDI